MSPLAGLAVTITARARTFTITRCWENIPSWGGGNSNYAFRQHLCCANSAPVAVATKWFGTKSGYKTTMKWSEAKAFCISSGYKNLCTAKQYVVWPTDLFPGSDSSRLTPLTTHYDRYCPDGANPSTSGIKANKWSAICRPAERVLPVHRSVVTQGWR